MKRLSTLDALDVLRTGATCGVPDEASDSECRDR